MSTIDRLPVETVRQLAQSAACLSRWSARIFLWGESNIPAHQRPFGYDVPVIVRVPAALGPAFAASCIGAPVNYALRAEDGLRCHYQPSGPDRFLHGIHPEVVAGFIERCHVDDAGLLATLVIVHPEAHDDLARLAKDDALGHAGVCLVYGAEAVVGRTPWGAVVADVLSARAVSLDFATYPVVPGCRILRRLEPDEELTAEGHALPPPRLMVPADWRAIDDAAMTRVGGDVGMGQIATGNIVAGAVSQHAYTFSAALVPLSTPPYQTIASITRTTTGGLVELLASVTISVSTPSTNGNTLAAIRIRNTLTGAHSVDRYLYLPGGSTDLALTLSSVFQEAPPAGTYTWVVEGYKASDATVQSVNHDFTFKEFKR